MDIKAYTLPSCILLACVMSMTFACMCRPNLKAEACNSDFVIIAKVGEEREMMSQKGWVFHYSLRVSSVLKVQMGISGSRVPVFAGPRLKPRFPPKQLPSSRIFPSAPTTSSSEKYEGAEKIMQTKLRGDGCGDRLQKGHVYIFAGHVGEFVDEGIPRTFLEVQFCNYVDFKDLALNEEVRDEISEIIDNPPACLERRAHIEKLGAFNDPFRSLKRWNHPFQKKETA